ncbi:MAG TPA: tetratricopeptide repeat protein [Pyrinomonadaceae bacterium]|jgi:tetratricopeptide (TPR) repeat protein
MSRSTGHRPLLFAAVALFACIAPAAAQPGSRQVRLVSVHGQVRYAGGAPADNVMVRLELFTSGVVGEMQTDRLGKFQFSGLMPELYVVRVHMPGYVDAEQQVDLKTSISSYVQLQLVADKYSRVGARLPPAGVVNAGVPAAARAEYDAALAALQDARDMTEAIAHLEKAVALAPAFVEAQLLLGTAYMDAGDLGKAEAALRRVLALEPKAAVAHFALGEIYRRQKRYKEAEAALLAGLKLDDRSVKGHFTLGRVYFEQNNLVKAGPQVGTALQLKPDFAAGHLLAGNILLRARQPENALTEFEEYLRLAPDGEYAAQARATAQRIRQALHAGGRQ